MALNLWKMGGQPTSYNPLSTGAAGAISINIGLGSYKYSIKAKSNTGATLRIGDSGAVSITKDYVLTNVLQTYEGTFSKTTLFGSNLLYIFDVNSTGNIIIDSISLVQAPLPKLTINGVDGFNSGKWTFNPSSVVLDDVTLRTNAPAAWSSSSSNSMSVISGNSYSFTAFVTSNGSAIAGLLLNWLDVNGSLINSGGTWSCYTTNASETFVSATLSAPTNAVTLKVIATSNDVGTFTVRQPMVNYGSIPAPYSPKTGDKMVMPTAKKNLFLPFKYWTCSSGVNNKIDSSDYVTTFMPTASFQNINRSANVQPNTTYTLMLNTGFAYIYALDSNGQQIGNPLISAVSVFPVSFTTPMGCASIRLDWTHGGSSSGSYTFINPQLEQGTVATPFTPYDVKVNKKPQKYVPKKNCMTITDYRVDGVNNPNTIDSSNSNGISIVQGGTYTLSGYHTVYPDDACSNPRTSLLFTYSDGSTDNPIPSSCFVPHNDGNEYFIYCTGTANPNKTLVSVGGWVLDYGSGTFMNRSARNVQFELGGIATPFEPYTPILPPSRKGLSFNVKDYLSYSSPSFLNYGTELYINVDFVYKGCTGYQGLIKRNDAAWGIYESPFTIGINPSSSVFFGIKCVGGIFGGYHGTTLVVGQKYSIAFQYNYLGLYASINGVNSKIGNYQGVVDFTNSSDLIINDSNLTSNDIQHVKIANENGTLLDIDFTNPKNIVGNQVIPDAQNLIPSFEDASWSIHPNAKVLGKDVLQLNATGQFQSSTVNIPFPSNTKLLALNTVSANIWEYDASGTQIKGTAIGSGSSITTQPTTVKIQLELTNVIAGSFDFIKPQLYQLSGQEGTINGAPVALNKPSKRTLYAKR